MTAPLLTLVREGKQEEQIDPNLSEAACTIYFKMFIDMFTTPTLQNQFL